MYSICKFQKFVPQQRIIPVARNSRFTNPIVHFKFSQNNLITFGKTVQIPSQFRCFTSSHSAHETHHDNHSHDHPPAQHDEHGGGGHDDHHAPPPEQPPLRRFTKAVIAAIIILLGSSIVPLMVLNDVGPETSVKLAHRIEDNPEARSKLGGSTVFVGNYALKVVKGTRERSMEFMMQGTKDTGYVVAYFKKGRMNLLTLSIPSEGKAYIVHKDTLEEIPLE